MRRRALASARARKRPNALTFAIRIARSAAVFAKLTSGSRAKHAQGLPVPDEALMQTLGSRFVDRSAPTLRAGRDFGQLPAALHQDRPAHLADGPE